MGKSTNISRKLKTQEQEKVYLLLGWSRSSWMALVGYIWGSEATMTILLRLESIHKQKKIKIKTDEAQPSYWRYFRVYQHHHHHYHPDPFFLSSSATLAEHLSTAQPAIMKSQFLKKQKAEQLFSFRCWWETECERIDCTNTHTYLLRIYLTTVLLLNYYHYHYLLLLQLEDNNLSGKKLKKKKKGGK